MLYWKRRDAKLSLDEVAASDNGGNLDIEIDQKFNPTSPNAQSGTAVAEAVSQVEEEITKKYGGVLKYKGTKTNYSALQAETTHEKGDVWNVSDTNANYVWDGAQWDKLSENLEGYVTNATFNSLQSSFTSHKANQDPNIRHLTNAELSKVQSIKDITEDTLRQSIMDMIQEQIAAGNLVTKDSLTTNLKRVETTVQQTVTQNITETMSGDYVLNSDFESYKTAHQKDLEGYIKCDQADELKVYTPDGDVAPPLNTRQKRTLYIVGAGATVAAN